jgi:hypothetical protein
LKKSNNRKRGGKEMHKMDVGIIWCPRICKKRESEMKALSSNSGWTLGKPLGWNKEMITMGDKDDFFSSLLPPLHWEMTLLGAFSGECR